MSFVRSVIASLVLVGIAVPADAAMTVQTFLARANALRDQGPMALMSADLPVLKAEAKAATTQLRAERAARAAAGIMDMLDGLEALPAADKRRPLKDGYARVLAKRFPC
jgi:hypothetical protein